MNWAMLWEYSVYSALGLYFGLAVVIAIGGAFDVRKMFRRLNAMGRERSAIDCPVCAARESAEKIGDSNESAGG